MSAFRRDKTPAAAPAAPPAEEPVVRVEIPDQTPGSASADWSYFDPSQRRFAALLAKLDEITAD